ncbi:MAG: hypothetical protein B7733_20520 [Myxococcales bacterium FL481]|nr:MAG: hypothetical protein B7733_20520 [Myxococcales bacterium FL481]
MSDLDLENAQSVLHRGWSATVGDYAIAGEWTGGGDALVVGDAAGSVYAFDGRSGDVAWTRPEAHNGGLLALAVHPRGTSIATAGQDGRILVWNADDGEIVRSIEFGNQWVENLAWSPTGNWLAASSSRQVRTYDTQGQQVWQSGAHPSTVSAIAWSSANELATACYGRVAFFDVPAGKLRQQLEWKASLISMAFNPAGDVVACGGQDLSVHFWRRPNGEGAIMSGYTSKPSALTFDASGTLLATSGGEVVTVWSFADDGPEGTRPGLLELHIEPVSSLAFAPSGPRLASGARDGAVVVWSLQRDGDGVPVGADAVSGGVSCVRWRPDGHALAAMDAQGGVTVWRVQDEAQRR